MPDLPDIILRINSTPEFERQGCNLGICLSPWKSVPGRQTYEVYVVISRYERTYSNAEVSANGSELSYREYTDDQDNGYYIGSLNSVSEGDSITLEVDFPLIGLIEKSLQIPYGIPEFTVDPALPAPGVPIDPNTGPPNYAVLVSSVPPPRYIHTHMG